MPKSILSVCRAPGGSSRAGAPVLQDNSTGAASNRRQELSESACVCKHVRSAAAGADEFYASGVAGRVGVDEPYAGPLGFGLLDPARFCAAERVWVLSGERSGAAEQSSMRGRAALSGSEDGDARFQGVVGDAAVAATTFHGQRWQCS